MTRRLVVLAVLLLSASAARAADEKRFTLSAYGVFAATSTDYQGTRTFDAFAEQGSITTDYDSGTGPGGEIGFTWRFSKNFGVGLAGTFVTRDATASYTANVPHPLYLNRNRTAEGTVDVEYQETAGHLDFVYLGHSGPLDFSVFAGPSFVNLSADLLIDPVYSQQYPFDTITVTNCRRSSSKTRASASTRAPRSGTGSRSPSRSASRAASRRRPWSFCPVPRTRASRSTPADSRSAPASVFPSSPSERPARSGWAAHGPAAAAGRARPA